MSEEQPKYPSRDAATDVTELIGTLGGGTFEMAMSVALSQVAARVVDHDPKKGKVSVTFEFERIPGTYQVRVSHTLKFQSPTALGSKSEETSGSDVLTVGKGGELKAAQADMFGVGKGSQRSLIGD